MSNDVKLSKLQIVTNGMIFFSFLLYLCNKLDIGTYIFGVEEIEHFKIVTLCGVEKTLGFENKLGSKSGIVTKIIFL